MKQIGDYVVETDGQAIPTWCIRMADSDEYISNHDTEKEALAALKCYQADDKRRSLHEHLSRRHRRPAVGRQVREDVISNQETTMTETRDFPTAVIASISTGVLLCDFGAMQEAAEYLMGHPIWTHHFADRQLCAEMRRTIAEQCPGMPIEIEGVTSENYREKVAEIERALGKTVRIRKGGGLTAMLPTDGIPDHLKNNTIAVRPR